MVRYVQLKARQQRSGQTLREFEANIDRLTRLAYPEESEDFQTWIAHIVFIDSITDSQLQQVLRMVWHQNSYNSLVSKLQSRRPTLIEVCHHVVSKWIQYHSSVTTDGLKRQFKNNRLRSQ